MKSQSGFLDRLTDGVDLVAGLCLAIVTILIFFSAIGRYFFHYPIPENFDISRFLLGAAVMWGFAVLGYSGKHITVDLIAETSSAGVKRVMDAVSQLVLLLFTIVLAWKMFDRLDAAYLQHEATFELRIQVWPFMGLIWGGVVAAIFTSAARLIRIFSSNTPLDEEAVTFHE